MNKEKLIRNLNILKATESGETLTAIANKVGLNRSTVALCRDKARRHLLHPARRGKSIDEAISDAVNNVPLISNSSEIKFIDCSVRLKNCLLNYGICTKEQVAEISDFEFMQTPNFGRISMAELRKVFNRKPDGTIDYWDKDLKKWIKANG